MYNMKTKIIRALIEGCFCKKAISNIDRNLGMLTRKLVSNTSEIQNNKIFFMTYQNDYACNPKYIAEEIIKQKLPYDLVWAVKDINKLKAHFPNEIRLVKRNSYEFYKEAMTSHIWIDNSINFLWENVPKKNVQKLFSTWHGSMGLKRVGKDDNKNLEWIRKAALSNEITDYCISNSGFENSVYKETWWPDVEILEYGHPRNDILFNTDEKYIAIIKNKVCEKLGIEDGLKIALYAPTFRDAKNIDCYDIDYEKLINALKIKFGGDWVILVRHHFHIRNSKLAANSISSINNVVRATNYDDMQELMLVADVGITDYSSWICDFILTGKPGFIFATDLNEYNHERGLYYPLETTPFPVAENNEQLIENILKFDENKYYKRVEVFLKDKCCFEDGKASYRVVEKIKEIIGAK